MPQSSVIALADIYAISGRRQELVAALADAEAAATVQPGCVRYSFTATIADPDHYVLISVWRDQAAMDAHYASPEFATYQLSLNGLLARPSEMTVYPVTGSARPLPSGPMDPRDAD
jgi:quinol monooxygenase YgiN